MSSNVLGRASPFLCQDGRVGRLGVQAQDRQGEVRSAGGAQELPRGLGLLCGQLRLIVIIVMNVCV